MEPLGVSVTVFMPDEEPNGLRVVEMLNWTGQGIVFPKSRFEKAKAQPALEQTGTYLLRGMDDDDHPVIYVGEGERVIARLSAHFANKDFWTLAAAFVSKDMNLNMAHVQYLEGRLLQVANDANRCTILNNQQPGLPNLAPSDRAFAEHFLRNVLTCLSAVGVHEFEEREKPQDAADSSGPGLTDSGHDEFTLNQQGADARGYESSEGFVVIEGSCARKAETPAFAGSSGSIKRKSLIEAGVLVADEDDSAVYVFTGNHLFNSPSQAAGVLVGGFVSGPEYWRVGTLTLKQWREQKSQVPNDDA